MEAMIFAAGLGTRMAPLTDTMPKALVPVRGRPLIGHVMDRLVAAGARRIIVNTSVHGDQIADWLAANARRGVEIVISPEPDGPYDTGGGLAAAAHLFLGPGPFILHNVDVLSRIPLDRLLEEHALAGNAVATLAVQDRPTRRRVLFDDEGLMGWGSDRVREPVGPVRDLAFSGIHVIERAVLERAATRAAPTYPIRDLYLELAGNGFVIRAADVTAHAWMDVGTPERLRSAESFPS